MMEIPDLAQQIDNAPVADGVPFFLAIAPK
jgi:hypothetical protein